MLRRVQTIIFKTIGTDSPQAYSLRKIYSPAPPFQCCVPIFILFQAATVYTTYTGNVSSRFFVIYQYFDAGYDYVQVLTAIVYFYVSIQSS